MCHQCIRGANVVDMTTSRTDLKRLVEVRRLYKSGEAQRIRRAAVVSQADFARSLGVSRSAVCLWESGDRTPRSESALQCWTLLELLQGASE